MRNGPKTGTRRPQSAVISGPRKAVDIEWRPPRRGALNTHRGAPKTPKETMSGISR